MKEKKNICVAINSLEMGGAEKQALILVQSLKPYHNVTLVIVDPIKEIYPPRLETLKQLNIEPIFLPKNLLGKTIKLTRLLKKQKIEFAFSFLATDTVLSAVCGRMAGVPFIFGGIRSSLIPKFKFAVLRFIHNHISNYTIANNYAGQRVAHDFGYKRKVLVIPNGIEIRPLQGKMPDSNQITIISLGRLVLAKRYETAIQAIAHLKTISQNSCRITYKIVGQGPEEENIFRAIEKFGVQNEVELIKGASEIYPLLDDADIYLCSSYFEGISNAIMEAMNCALPIVATDVGDNSYLVKDEDNGFIVAVDDYLAMAEKLKQLIDNVELRELMGVHSYKHLVENYSFEAFQQKYLKIISGVENL